MDKNYYSNLQNQNTISSIIENSASASNLAAAVKDRKAGIIIGTSTYGKEQSTTIILAKW